MNYGLQTTRKKHEIGSVGEKAYKRKESVVWEASWHGLSAQARDSFLNVVKGPVKYSRFSHQPGVRTSQFEVHILEELTNAGFVEVKSSNARASDARVYAAGGLYDFATRVRSLQKFHLLVADRPSEFVKYVDRNFFSERLGGVLSTVLQKVRGSRFVPLDRQLAVYVMHRRWPGLVAAAVDDPLAGRILEVIQEAGGSIPLAELPGRISGSEPDQVRSVMGEMIGRLALVEDLRPETLELMVGFLPSVHEEMVQAGKTRERPPLVAYDRLQEVGPDSGVIVDDLRSTLLEIASEPPQLRQDRTLFQKERERFLAVLEPMGDWLSRTLKWTQEGRVDQAISWARALRMVKTGAEGKRIRLELTPKGHEWLSGGIEDQYVGIYTALRAFGSHEDIDSQHSGLSFHGMDAFHRSNTRDNRFLGEQASVVKADLGQFFSVYGDVQPKDRLALREQLDRALAVLKPGVFYRLDGVAAHISFGEFNPLNRGLPLDEVSVDLGYQTIPALEEEREKAGGLLICYFVLRRLIPLGCVRAAVDEERQLCIARLPRLDAYFGREIDPAEMATGPLMTAKVVVQPDFTVTVIGLNPAPFAELAPFCERTTRGRGQGAVTMRITRESVIKAVCNGLKPGEIVSRLERHASKKVPANVIRQVTDWSSWVRPVTSSTRTLLRCPDSETADRVMAAIKSQAERVSDTMVAYGPTTLSEADRSKLRSNGIIVQGESEALGADS